VENVELALRILGSRRIPRGAKVGHLDLVAPLNSGLTVSIPGKRELTMAVLRTESSLVGRTVQSFYEVAGDNRIEIVAVLRDRDVILPEPDTVLQENDQLLLVGSIQTVNRMAEHIEPLKPELRKKAPVQPADRPQI
jgi:uncharacterized protein with PhoU and TrkA domain